MDLGRIRTLRQALEAEEISLSEISEIDSAFIKLQERGVELREDPEHALAIDMLDELEDNATEIERVIYHWVLNNFGEKEANNPSWSTYALAEEINKVKVVFDVEKGTIGHLLGEV